MKTWVLYSHITLTQFAVSSSPRPWMDVFSLPEELNMPVTESDLAPRGPNNVNNFLISVQPLIWACRHGTKMLLILKKTIYDLIIPW